MTLMDCYSDVHRARDRIWLSQDLRFYRSLDAQNFTALVSAKTF
jgi:hypothetical protein